MKITISESKWKEIGKKAGWLKNVRKANFIYENDNLSGELFDKPGFIYTVSLKYEQDIKDDSDYNSENGYGKLENPIGDRNIISFTVNEYDSSGTMLNEHQLSEINPGLLFKIEKFCIANATEE